jgi:hypothetical protein
VASAAASVDLPRAADWTLQHYQGRYGDGLLGRIGNTWAMRDGPGAMAWLAALPESPRRERGVEDTYRAWLDWDNVGALDWMKQREAQPEPWLEPAFALYVVSVSPQDPEHALALSQKILDGDRRDGVVVTIARMWRASAPDAADAWLARAELSPAVRAMILQAQGPQDIPAGDSAQLPDAP